MKILACDGGGIRGVLSAEILRRLEEEHKFLARVDLFAGTSTGSIIAAALAAGLHPERVVDLYSAEGAAIFAPRDLADRLAGSLDEYVRANYGSDGLRRALTGVFGDAVLGDLPRGVLIPTVYLGDEARPASVKVFHNLPGPGTDRAVRVVDALMASAAAPLYFPAHDARDPRLPGVFADGGLAANNPAACALAKALKVARTTGAGGGYDVRLLSLSCGSNPLVVEGGDWGVRQWVVQGAPLVRLVFDGPVGVADYVCREILDALEGAYFRLDPKLPREVGLDDVAAVPELVRVAREVDLDEVAAWVRIHF